LSFFFHHTASTEIYTLSLHDALPILIFDIDVQGGAQIKRCHPETATVFVLPPSMAELERRLRGRGTDEEPVVRRRLEAARAEIEDRKSTRLNSSHVKISYAVFCLKKK